MLRGIRQISAKCKPTTRTQEETEALGTSKPGRDQLTDSKLHTESSSGPGSLTDEPYQTLKELISQKHTGPPTTAALFITAKTWMQPKCPLTEE